MSPREARHERWRLEVEQAYVNGCKIESRARGGSVWLEDKNPSFRWGYWDYRYVDGAGVAHDNIPDVDIIVTRHRSLADFLISVGLATVETPVIEEVGDWRQIAGKHVAGNLPIHLARLTEFYTAVTLLIPPTHRNKELSLKEVSDFAIEIAHYRVDPVKLVRKSKSQKMYPEDESIGPFAPPNHEEKSR